ncbi:hypothetical protein Fot_31645 [Forsythia ovata]|uniref:DUF3741 domain-containing protein n=1 Tax=Forsythia ovata TaxID=205694 RepID=A0ABD1T5Z8_9LAMI
MLGKTLKAVLCEQVEVILGFRPKIKEYNIRHRPQYLVQFRLMGTEMNELHQKGKNGNFEDTFPGCLGRMVKLFYLNVGVAGKKLLTDEPHRDDIARMNASGDQMEDKVIVSELRRTCSNRKTNGTPMKILTAQEMSKEKVSKSNQSNVVAKLMGLDTLLRKQPESAIRRSHSRGYPRRNSDTSMSNWEQKNGFFQYAEPIKYKDVYEIWQQSQRTNSVKDKSRHKGRDDEITNNTRMTLVRQKFIEAKRLPMDEKLRQSKQLQDALEVLSSNKDLFLACLQEPNAMLSQHLYNLQSIPPPETKRITVLRPSKVDINNFSAAGNNVGRGMKKNTFVGHLNGLEKCHLGCSPAASWKIDENPTQPTQILLLKPSPGKPHNVKAVGSRLPKSPMRLHGEDFFGDFKDDENQESRKVAKAITWQMSENLGRAPER